jgi:hypothetical protein
MTSLYLALRSHRPVPTWTDKKKRIDRHYYLDMVACLDPEVDRTDAVVSVPADRVVRTNIKRDLSTRELEFAQHMFPLDLIFDDVESGEWFMGYQEHHQYAQERSRFLNRFQQEIRQRFLRYKIPVIELLRGTPKEAVCQVFENVNTGGVALTVFELVTATFAADGFRLRPDWEARHKRLAKHDVLRKVSDTDFVQAVTLLSTYRRHQRQEGHGRSPLAAPGTWAI